jgi:hypothetical protein
VKKISRRHVLLRYFASSIGYEIHAAITTPRLRDSFFIPPVPKGIYRYSTFLQAERSNSTESLSIFEMDAARIQTLSIDELEEVVKQLDSLESLTSRDVYALLHPLIRRACDTGMNAIETTTDAPVAPSIRGARLAERIILNCLSRFPSDPEEHRKVVSDPSSDLPFPTQMMYVRTIIAWSGVKSEEAAERAEHILNLMKAEYTKEKSYFPPDADHQLRSPVPCRRSYKSVIRAWALSGATEGPAKALQYLQELEDASQLTLAQSSFELPQLEYPDRACFNMVLSSYAKSRVSKHPTALNQIKGIIARMDRYYERTGNYEFLLDSFSYHAVLQAYSKYIIYSGQTLRSNFVAEIDALLQRILHETRSEIVSTIRKGLDVSWATGVLVDALTKTEPRNSSLLRADRIVYDLAQRNERKSPLWRTCWPRNDTIIRLIKAWDESKLPDSEDRIQKLLQLVVDAPYTRIYEFNASMSELLDSEYKGAPFLVEKMLYRALENTSSSRELTGQTFAIAMKGFLRSSDPAAACRAESLFMKLMELYESRGERFEPREVHLRYALSSWLQKSTDGRRYEGLSGELYPAEHCENLLRWTIKKGVCSDNYNGLFALAIQAWCIQKLDADSQLNPVTRASALLVKLKDLTGKLSAFPCNYVLETCCRPQFTIEDRLHAYNTAIDTFRYGKRNARSFYLITEVLRTQVVDLDDQHVEVVEGLFDECCANGLLTQEMVWQVVAMLPLKSLKRLFGLSHDFAQTIINVRDDELRVVEGDYDKRIGLRWNRSPPKALLLDRLPSEWSRDATTTQRRTTRVHNEQALVLKTK